MSAPPGVASPGYVVTLNGRDKGMHYNTTYHSGGVKRLDGHFQSNGPVNAKPKATHVKVGLDEG